MKDKGAFGHYAFLFIPLLIEQGAITLIAAVNTALISGRANALVNAISHVEAVTFLLTAVFIAVATGSTILAARYHGSGQRDKIASVFRGGLVLGTAAAAVLAALTAFGGRSVLGAVYPGVSGAAFENCAGYLLLSALSFPFYFIFAHNTGIMRACGDTKRPMLITVLQGALNLSVTAFLLFAFDLGIFSAGLGLLLSRIFSAGLSFSPLRSLFKIRSPGPQGERSARGQYGEILRVGAFVALETILFFLGKLVLQTFIAKLPGAQVTANAVCGSLLNVLALPGMAMCVLTMNICGNLTGAGDLPGRRRFYIRAVAATAGMHLGVSLVSLPFLRSIVGLYTSDPAVFDAALKIMRLTLIMLPLTWPLGNITAAALRGGGKVRLVSAALSVSMWAYRIPVSRYLCEGRGLGALGVWIGTEFEWLVHFLIFAAVLGAGRYKDKKRRAYYATP